VSEECILRREVTIRCNDKIWFNSIIRREIRKRDRFCRKILKTLHLIVTSRLRIHSSDTERITLVKLIHDLSISGYLFIKFKIVCFITMIKYGSIQLFGGRYVNETDSVEKYLKFKTALSQTIFKQQRNRIIKLKKQ
jgi:hypothetical protein